MARKSKFYKGKVALITGAAGGIGKVIAESLASKGISVVIADVDVKNGKKAAAIIKKNGGSVLFVRINLRVERDIKDMIEAAVRKFGRLDMIINNARPKLRILPFIESLKEWELAMDVLLRAPALISKYSIPYLKKTDGNIINIVSTNAFFVSHQPVTYHVAKAGVIQLTRYLAYELGQFGIRVNAICPGLVDLYDKNNPLTGNLVNKAVTKLIVPLGRASTACDVANAVLFLCSDSASYITGHTLILDGGITLGDHFNIARKSFTHAPE